MSFIKTPLSTFEPPAVDIAARVSAYKCSITAEQAKAMLIREHELKLPPHLPAHTIPTADFIARIPVGTWAKVTAARQAGTTLAVALDQGIAQLCASPYVVATDAQLLAVLNQLVTAGVLTADEKAQILGF